MPKRVAVIGLSFRFPGTDTAGYWSALMGGHDLVTEVDAERWAKQVEVEMQKGRAQRKKCYVSIPDRHWQPLQYVL